MGRFLVQSAYDGALERVVDDLQAEGVPKGFAVRIDFSPTFDATGRTRIPASETEDMPYYFALDDGTGTHRQELPDVEDEEDATFHLAVCFQDDVLQYLWGPVWPRCPGHPHASDPVLVDGVATWCCPKTGESLARIGELRFQSP